jgi:hypothetical protein
VVALTLSGRRLIEGPQTRLTIEPRPTGASRHDADALAGGSPFDLAPRTDAELPGESLWHGHLKLARHLGHNPYYSKDTFLVQCEAEISGDR